jgi:hypothetical protein
LTHSASTSFCRSVIYATDASYLISLPIEFTANGTPPTAIWQFTRTTKPLPLVAPFFAAVFLIGQEPQKRRGRWGDKRLDALACPL